MRNVGIHLCAPCARDQFAALAADLIRSTRFRVFESYRGPVEQEAAFARGTSKARAYESPHQFGLAIDFVPWTGTEFVWPAAVDGEWEELDRLSAVRGLIRSIKWDRPHVEHRSWARIRTLICHVHSGAAKPRT
jgi:hypothetical protein